jgi:hypothetical protein
VFGGRRLEFILHTFAEPPSANNDREAGEVIVAVTFQSF